MRKSVAISLAQTALIAHMAGHKPNARVIPWWPNVGHPCWRVVVGHWHVYFLHGGMFVSATAAPLVGPPAGPDFSLYIR